MKTATTVLKDFLAQNRQFVTADLFDILLTNGTVISLTNVDIDVIWGGVVYSSIGPQIEGLRYRVGVGLDADEQTVTISAYRTMMLGNVPFLDAIRNGALDGATITRKRAYLLDWGQPVVGVVLLFTGYVSTIDKITRLTAEVKVKSDLVLLDINMPRRLYQAPCLNTVYDGQCRASKAANTVAGSADTGSTRSVIEWATSYADRFSQGTIEFTSGANAGIIRTVKLSSNTQITLAFPLPVAPSVGDTFNIVSGCDKLLATCSSRFSNSENFVAFPFIPAAEKAF